MSQRATWWRATIAWTVRNVSLRDATILLALALLWRGLATIYQPLAPVVTGAFLLWYTTVRRVAQ